ncbi:SDR family NAD(P)-dependent oxidoreductase [Bacillus solimangrovi]|uniref:Short-chain dehydrogenase n=1 Tax=Bacillus solimangrovi TaxID=1305675 RepID=A0A1E5LJH9_9BACI|nr:SDR family NAD(P)-dependent oxidoreductase [Bacillus solimangrovi]OEH94178.1 short-chain dehydrogenase [Bacillus solimangrovi]
MNYVILGASKGLGDAFVKGLPEQGDHVWIVSRSRPVSLAVNDGVHRHWIEADLSSNDSSNRIADALRDEPIDVLIYNAGIWEKEGFEDHYDFEKDDPNDIANIMFVNTTSMILCTQKLLPNLKQSANAKVILIGSADGIENNESKQVTYVASKFGVRGIGNSLRENLRKYEISVTCINPGNIAAAIPYEAGLEKTLSTYKGTKIPVQDIISLVKTITHLSKASCVKEINMPAMLDTSS